MHNLGESFSFTRLICALQSEAVKEGEAVAEKGFDRALSLAEAAWTERSYLAGTGAVDRPRRSRCEVALQFGMVELLSAGRGDDVPGPLL